MLLTEPVSCDSCELNGGMWKVALGNKDMLDGLTIILVVTVYPNIQKRMVLVSLLDLLARYSYLVHCKGDFRSLLFQHGHVFCRQVTA